MGKKSELTEDLVCWIRASKDSSAVLAKKYGVDPSAISSIRNNRTHKHVK